MDLGVLSQEENTEIRGEPSSSETQMTRLGVKTFTALAGQR
jgi:hypothetical protein